MQQMQFANRVKKTEKNKTKQNTRKKQKILHNLLGCRGYLPKGKSL